MAVLVVAVLVYGRFGRHPCGQTVGRIKTKLGMQVGLGPGHIVLDGDPAPLPIFGPYLLRPNGCMDQDVTWYGARPRPRR